MLFLFEVESITKENKNRSISFSNLCKKRHWRNKWTETESSARVFTLREDDEKGREREKERGREEERKREIWRKEEREKKEIDKERKKVRKREREWEKEREERKIEAKNKREWEERENDRVMSFFLSARGKVNAKIWMWAFPVPSFPSIQFWIFFVDAAAGFGPLTFLTNTKRTPKFESWIFLAPPPERYPHFITS